MTRAIELPKVLWVGQQAVGISAYHAQHAQQWHHGISAYHAQHAQQWHHGQHLGRTLDYAATT